LVDSAWCTFADSGWCTISRQLTTRTLFGALNIRTGRWVYLVRERLRQEDFIAFLVSVDGL